MAEGFLGSLVVEITTDLTNLNEGLKKADAQIKATSGKITEYTNKIATSMAVMGGAVVGAIGLMTKSAVDYANEIYTVSQRTGIAVETLSELKYIADQTESSFEAVSAGLRYLGRNMYEAQSGSIEMSNTFRKLGIQITDSNGKLLASDKVLLQIADKFQSMTSDVQKTGIAIELFGRSGEALIPVLSLGSEEIERLAQEAHDLGIVLTSENAQALDEFDDKTSSLKSALGGLWLTLSIQVIPTITRFVTQCTDAVKRVNEWSKEHPKLSAFLADNTLKLGALTLAVGVATLAISKLIAALKTVALFTGALTVLSTFRMAGLLTDVAILSKTVGLLYPAVMVVGTAFAAWNLGKFIGELEQVKRFLSGSDGLFTKMFVAWDNTMNKIQARMQGTRVEPVEGTTSPETKGVDLGKISVSKPQQEIEDQGILTDLLEEHARKLKELNDEYARGSLTSSEYMEGMIKLHEDGVDLRTREIELMNQQIEVGYALSDANYQRMSVEKEMLESANSLAQVKAELANQELVKAKNTVDAQVDLMKTLQSYNRSFMQGTFEFINMGLQTFTAGFTSAITSWVMGTKSASEAMKDFGKQMISAIVSFIAEWIIQSLIAMTIGAALSTFALTQASILAGAWAVPAFFAAVATLGGAVAAGTAALAGGAATTVGMVGGMKSALAASSITGKASGGDVLGSTPYIVGEKGPELFVPDSAGTIVPNDRLGGGDRNVTINFYDTQVSSSIDVDELAQTIGSRVKIAIRGA